MMDEGTRVTMRTEADQDPTIAMQILTVGPILDPEKTELEAGVLGKEKKKKR